MYFRVLGPVELRDQDGAIIEIPAEKQRRLLTALLLRANTWVSSSYLIDAVWPDTPPRSTRNNVKTYIHHVRGVMAAHEGDDRIESRRGAYRLRVERHECDATVFEDRVIAATGELARTRPAVAVEQLEAALELWRGDPYEPLTGTDVEAEAERLRALLWHTRYALAEALLVADRAADAITLLWPLTAQDPLREKTWVHLLRALSADGRWAEVLVAFQKVRGVLADELGVTPGPELRRLHQFALRAEDSRQGPDDVPSTSANRTDTGDEAIGAVVTESPRGAVPRQARFAGAPSRWRWRHARSDSTPEAGWPWRLRWSALFVLLIASSWSASAWLVPTHPAPTTRTPASPDTGTPVVTFLSPKPGQAVRGVVTIRVKVSNPTRLRQVDFHQLTSRCREEGEKTYIGMDKTPSPTGIYEISFDTHLASNGCLDFGAVGLDRTNDKILYPTGGTYVPTTVDN